MPRYALGLHFGLDQLRALVVDVGNGRVAADVARPCARDPRDPVDALAAACRAAIEQTGIDPAEVIGIGVAFAGSWTAGFASPDCVARVNAALGRDWESSNGAAVGAGRRAGTLGEAGAARLGLAAGIAISDVVLDAHAALPGAGIASPSTALLHLQADVVLLNSRIGRDVAPVARFIDEGILPGYAGYEIPCPFSIRALDELATADVAERAVTIAPGAARPQSGAPPEHRYRSLVESGAFELRRRVDAMRGAGIPVRRFVATGESPRHPLLLQTCADVLGEKITLAASDAPAALGAAILGALAAGPAVTGRPHLSQTIHALARQREDVVYRPDLSRRRAYERIVQDMDRN